MTDPGWRPMVEAVVLALLTDSALSSAQRLDFGIIRDDHYRGMRRAVEVSIENDGTEATYRALDAALGHSALLTAFVRDRCPEWGDTLQFTGMDLRPPEPKPPTWSLATEALVVQILGGTFTALTDEQIDQVGMATDAHARALHAAFTAALVEHGPAWLYDAVGQALGDGPKLTNLVRRFGGQSWADITFQSAFAVTVSIQLGLFGGRDRMAVIRQVFQYFDETSAANLLITLHHPDGHAEEVDLSAMEIEELEGAQ
jgi:hypothetical protein